MDITKLKCVERVNEWRDRMYITLSGINRRANADIRTKIWIRGNTLTIERGKGYYSAGFLAAEEELVNAVKANGGTVREI